MKYYGVIPYAPIELNAELQRKALEKLYHKSIFQRFKYWLKNKILGLWKCKCIC
jgi:uncharacterized protein YqgQ